MFKKISLLIVLFSLIAGTSFVSTARAAQSSELTLSQMVEFLIGLGVIPQEKISIAREAVKGNTTGMASSVAKIVPLLGRCAEIQKSIDLGDMNLEQANSMKSSSRDLAGCSFVAKAIVEKSFSSNARFDNIVSNNNSSHNRCAVLQDVINKGQMTIDQANAMKSNSRDLSGCSFVAKVNKYGTIAAVSSFAVIEIKKAGEYSPDGKLKAIIYGMGFGTSTKDIKIMVGSSYGGKQITPVGVSENSILFNTEGLTGEQSVYVLRISDKTQTVPVRFNFSPTPAPTQTTTPAPAPVTTPVPTPAPVVLTAPTISSVSNAGEYSPDGKLKSIIYGSGFGTSTKDIKIMVGDKTGGIQIVPVGVSDASILFNRPNITGSQYVYVMRLSDRVVSNKKEHTFKSEITPASTQTTTPAPAPTQTSVTVPVVDVTRTVEVMCSSDKIYQAKTGQAVKWIMASSVGSAPVDFAWNGENLSARGLSANTSYTTTGTKSASYNVYVNGELKEQNLPCKAKVNVTAI